MIQTRPSEFDLFVMYGRRTKELLKKVFYLGRLPTNENVMIEYATPSRAFAKFLVPVVNGAAAKPLITFFLENAEYIENENMLGWIKEHIKENNKAKILYAPIVQKLNYKVAIHASTPVDCDRLAYQALAYTRKNNKMAEYFQGQWIEWHGHSLTEENNIEAGLEDKIVKKTFTLTIPRAYLPVDYSEVGLIHTVDLEQEINEVREESLCDIN